MFKHIPRYTYLTLLGICISFILIGFIFFIFQTIYHSQNANIFTDMDTRIYRLLSFTIYQAFLSTIISVIIGTLLAWSISYRKNFFGRKILISIFSSSLVLPSLIVVFGLIGVFGRNGYINQISLFLFDISFGTYIYGLVGILLAHTYLNASFASRALLSCFESIPQDKYKLAKSLNFTPWQRFIYIEYPMLKPTLLSISTTIFLLCFSSFAIVLLLGGSPEYNTLEVAIYEAIKLDFDISFALQIALIQITVAIVLVLASSKFKIDSLKIGISTLYPEIKYSKLLKVLQYIVIFIFSLFFISPLLVIIIDGIGANFNQILNDPIFIQSFLTSLIIAFISSIITIFITIIMSNARTNLTSKIQRRNDFMNTIFDNIIIFSSNIYLAVPSLVLGLGFFIVSQRYDDSQYIWSWIAVLTANVLMSLPFAYSILTPIMTKTAQSYDKLNLSLNLSLVQKWIYVQYPHLKNSLVYVFALSFCFSLGDLGIISLFENEDFITLPWYLYQLMGSYKTQDAAGVALILLTLIISTFVLLPRIFRSDYVKNQ